MGEFFWFTVGRGVVFVVLWDVVFRLGACLALCGVVFDYCHVRCGVWFAEVCGESGYEGCGGRGIFRLWMFRPPSAARNPDVRVMF